MLIASQRMTDEDCVRLVGVEFAIGLIGDTKWRKRHTAIQVQRLASAKIHHRTVGICRFLALLSFFSGWSADFRHVCAIEGVIARRYGRSSRKVKLFSTSGLHGSYVRTVLLPVTDPKNYDNDTTRHAPNSESRYT